MYGGARIVETTGKLSYQRLTFDILTFSRLLGTNSTLVSISVLGC